VVRARERSVRVSVVAILLGLSVAASAVAAQSQVRIDNFGRVNANYFRGAQPEGQDYADLAALGIKTVINLTSDDADPNEPAMVARSGMRYVQIPMTTNRAPTAAQLSQFLSIVQDPASQPVYVHCVGGKHRTGVMTAVYRMTDDGWSSDQAFAEMKRYQFGADFLHSEFKRFVYDYPAQMTRAAAVNASATATKADANAKLQK
jgi:tyrosine-protein phosphatase SIW14